MADLIQEDAKLTPYFESTEPEGSIAGDGADYAAGLRDARSGVGGVHIALRAASVERVLLARARLKLMLDPEGLIYVEPMGLVDEVVVAGKQRGQVPMATILDLVKATVTPDNLRGEEEPLAALALLRAQLNDALMLVDAAVAQVKGGSHGSG
jgi:hypothetical protein